ncbi:MAG: class I SAM-dependent methyltransferase [Pirellulaceae bacterium]
MHFALMLDPTMTYSSGYFGACATSLQEAFSHARKIRPESAGSCKSKADDHVLGNRPAGVDRRTSPRCTTLAKVTTTTISHEQHAYAKNRLLNAGLGSQVTLLKEDYRDLHGKLQTRVHRND